MTINKFIGVGNVGRDPEYRVTAEGNGVANVSIATTEKYKDKHGQQKEVTEWINLVFFGKLAEIVAQYVTKGMQIYVEGKLKTDKYEKDGIVRYNTKVVCEKMQMLGGGTKQKQKQDDEERNELNRQVAEQDAFGDDDIPF
jgi:single-strand DNA-binding protein